MTLHRSRNCSSLRPLSGRRVDGRSPNTEPMNGEKELDVLHGQNVFDHHNVHQVADLVPGVFFAHRVGDKPFFDIVADHRPRQLHPRKGAEMAVDVLNGLVEIQPHARQVVIPGQGKARGRSRDAAFRFSIHGLSIHQTVQKSIEPKIFC